MLMNDSCLTIFLIDLLVEVKLVILFVPNITLYADTESKLCLKQIICYK